MFTLLRKEAIKIQYLKAKFNLDQIANSNTIYPEDFVELATRYKNEIILVEEEVFGGYELELEGRTFALNDEELIFIND